jgi:hypothetical protein
VDLPNASFFSSNGAREIREIHLVTQLFGQIMHAAALLDTPVFAFDSSNATVRRGSLTACINKYEKEAMELASDEESRMTTAKTEQSGLAVADDLHAAMQGKIVVQGDASYWEVRRIWRGAVSHQPLVFALCETVGDVQAAVRPFPVVASRVDIASTQPDYLFGSRRTLRTSWSCPWAGRRRAFLSGACLDGRTSAGPANLDSPRRPLETTEKPTTHVDRSGEQQTTR